MCELRNIHYISNWFQIGLCANGIQAVISIACVCVCVCAWVSNDAKTELLSTQIVLKTPLTPHKIFNHYSDLHKQLCKSKAGPCLVNVRLVLFGFLSAVFYFVYQIPPKNTSTFSIFAVRLIKATRKRNKCCMEDTWQQKYKNPRHRVACPAK